MESQADCINKNKVSKLTLNPASPGSPTTPADPGEPWQKGLNIQLAFKHGKNSFFVHLHHFLCHLVSPFFLEDQRHPKTPETK